MLSATGSERARLNDSEDTIPLPRLPLSTSPTEMVFPHPRAGSPALLSLRFGAQKDAQQPPKRTRESRSPDIFLGARLRRASTQTKPNDKGKDPVRADSSVDSSSSFGENNWSIIDRDPFASHYNGQPSTTLYDSSRPSKAETFHSKPKRTRGSLLASATDALGLKFGRRKPVVRPPPPLPLFLPDVIEITAPRPDEEVEERNRLREEAAQALGIASFIQKIQPLDDSSDEEEEKKNVLPLESAESRPLNEVRNSDSATNITGKLLGSSLSVAIPSTPLVARHRSGSVLAHTRTNSVSLDAIPIFPTTVSALNACKQSVATFPKYYPPPSLRIFALSKSWKVRFLVLSSPPHAVNRHSGPAVSYLHLFKSSAPEEKELERLEINEDSVVFVSEEEVGGRRQVIKVGGIDVGALKKELNHEESGRTMWFLQITDSDESQKWISNIKNVILGQRTVRAGLGLPGTLGGIEPRGDMDVMFSIRAQGLITSPPRPLYNPPLQTIQQAERNYASSISSHSVRSQTIATPKPSSPGPISTFKGLFHSSTRPRSASRATSIDSERPRLDKTDKHDDSFATMGTNLLSLLRSSTPDTLPHSSSANGTQPSTNLYFSSTPPDIRINQKITTDRRQWDNNDSTATVKVRANRALSLGALPLQPPPRKRWTSVGPGSIKNDSETYTKPNNTEENIFGNPRALHDAPITEPPSPLFAGFSFGTPEQRPKAPSLHSVSTLASGEYGLSAERSSSSTKRSSSAKRWSRQGALPNRSTPPNGPPPSIPNPINQSVTFHAHPYSGTGDTSPSKVSSSNSVNSEKSVVSSLPTFSKRASASSAFSIRTSSTSQSHASLPSAQSLPVRPGNANRASMPPPRPAPTFALPPAPDQITTKRTDTSSSRKSSFRNSAHRAFRLSMIAPKPPPSTNLPPRPDEPGFIKSHRRSSSSGNTSSNSEFIPPISIPTNHISPFPPPRGPLPPTPANSDTSQNLLTTRHSSIKRRLRHFSAPSSPFGSTSNTNNSHLSRPTTMTFFTTTSPPVTPIAEKITLFQNDPSFLQMSTPIIPSAPPPLSLPPSQEQYPEIVPLSPPPRRNSKQISMTEAGSDIQSNIIPSETPPLVEEGPWLVSLSRPGSVRSLGIVNL